MSFLSELGMFSNTALPVAFLCNCGYSIILDWKQIMVMVTVSVACSSIISVTMVMLPPQFDTF